MAIPVISIAPNPYMRNAGIGKAAALANAEELREEEGEVETSVDTNPTVEALAATLYRLPNMSDILDESVSE